MGITMFTFGGVFAPFASLLGRLDRRNRIPLLQPARPAATPPQPARTCAPRSNVPARPCEKARQPLRVVRVVERAGAPAGAGRMFISGRMADVCAELDRLAALEAG